MSTLERAQSDFKKLKSKYTSQLSTLKELFSDWTEEDLLFTLQDADGDLELAIDRISEGHANQWGEVKTKKSKKEAAAAAAAAAANKEPAVAITTSSISSTTSYHNNTSSSNNSNSKYNAKPPKRPTPSSQRKPQAATAVSWQSMSKKPEFDGWGNDGWKTHADSKKISSSSTPTKSSNGGGAKTWASLLQSKPEPTVVVKEQEQEEKPVETLPPLKKLDDAWLSPNNNSNDQWDQPIQSTEKEEPTRFEDEIAVDFNKLSIQQQEQDKPSEQERVVKEEEKNVPEKTSSSHPSVADILNSVKPIENTDNELPQQPLNQPMYHQQQYQQFGMQDYSPFAMHDYGMYGGSDSFLQQQQRSSYYDQSKFGLSQDATDKTNSNDVYQQQHLYNNMQSFYPYYYMPNQFSAYQPYGQQQTQQGSFMNRSMYPYNQQPQQQEKPAATTTSVTNGTATTNASTPSASTGTSMTTPYGNASPYNPIATTAATATATTQNLYGGFDDFGLNSALYQQQQQGFLNSSDRTLSDHDNTRKTSPLNQQQQQQQQQPYSAYFGQSNVFSYGQQQPYRGSSNNQQYWNQ